MGAQAVFKAGSEAADEVPMLALRTAGERADMADSRDRIASQGDQAQQGRRHQELESVVHAQRIAGIRTAERPDQEAATA